MNGTGWNKDDSRISSKFGGMSGTVGGTIGTKRTLKNIGTITS